MRQITYYSLLCGYVNVAQDLCIFATVTRSDIFTKFFLQ